MSKPKEINFMDITKYKSLYNCSSYEQFIEKINDLQEAKQILNSQKEEIQKVYEIFILFSKYRSGFDRAYKLFLENGKDDPELRDCYEYISIISEQLKKWQEKGMINVVKAIDKLVRKMERNNFDEAQKTIIDYINYEGISIDDFCVERKIIPDTFEKHRRTVFSLAPDSKLYKSFLEKCANDVQIEYQNAIKDFKDIANAIKNGFFEDGTNFSKLEFWARIPFRNAPVKQFNRAVSCFKNVDKISATHFRGTIISFTKLLVQRNIMSDEQYETLYNYIIANNIGELYIYKEVDIKHYAMGIVSGNILNSTNNSKTIYEVNDEDIIGMINYMKSRKIPMNLKAFNVVFEAYINGEITIKEINDLKKRRVL